MGRRTHDRISRTASKWWRLLAVSVAATLTVSVLAFTPQESAEAYTGADFDAGYIIDDALFYDGNAMTAAQIQTFLDAKVKRCENGRCLNVAQVSFAGKARSVSSKTGKLICEAIQGGSMSTAELVHRTQVACGISAKVILVTMQKEQGLVTSRAPGDWALLHAMGMACPDSAPCSSAFEGLATQIVTGTEQLKVYKAAAFSRQPGRHSIQWNPEVSCGSTMVDIRNFATAALYNYTPYRPNAAALANLGGTGDECSSYGNRNFWRFYHDWFGSPTPVNPLNIAVDRIGGTDRVDTALQVSQRYFDASTDVVYVANALEFPDALSAVAAAALENAPLLITPPDTLPETVRAEISRLSPSKIVVIGGEGAVTKSVLTQLSTLATTTRLGGNDRYETSRITVESVFAGGAGTVYLATGSDFADALSASAVAANTGAPVVLIDGAATTLDADTRALLQRLGTTKTIIAGGTGVVSAQIEQALRETPGMIVERHSGESRYDTSLALTNAAFTSTSQVFLASGENFPDALAGAAAAGKIKAPLYLVLPSCVPRPSIEHLVKLGATSATILGGTSVVWSTVNFWKNC